MSGPLTYIPEPGYSSVIRDESRSRKPKKPSWVVAVALIAVVTVSVGAHTLLSAPAGFPSGEVVVVERGETLSGIASELRARDVIRSEFAFKAFLAAFGSTRGLIAGDYALREPQNVIEIAWRFSKGAYGLESVRITIPEGTSVPEVADIFSKSGSFTRFDRSKFVALASAKEGYLFPDTYFFLPNVEAEQVISAMSKNFERRIATLEVEIQGFGRSLSDVMKMASIIEEEARTEVSRRIIAGILWKRLEEGMPLQVDAAFAFVNGIKDSALLTLDDLKIDSPYNTYVYKGLPPTPISNPGLAAIEATIKPMKTPYYYYLSDKKGDMHYAITHDEHVANKNRYLR